MDYELQDGIDFESLTFRHGDLRERLDVVTGGNLDARVRIEDAEGMMTLVGRIYVDEDGVVVVRLKDRW